MDRFLRRATSGVLLFLAVVVWFEGTLFGGDRGALRLVVGVLCIYVALQSLERQRLHDTFKQVLATFQQYRERTGREGDSSATPSARDRREAAAILVAALRRGGATADLALANLQRVTGQDFGHDAEAWQRWLDAQPRE